MICGMGRPQNGAFSLHVASPALEDQGSGHFREIFADDGENRGQPRLCVAHRLNEGCGETYAARMAA
jgi:hypothetical protein